MGGTPEAPLEPAAAEPDSGATGHFGNVGQLLTWAVRDLRFKGSDDVFGVLSVNGAADIEAMGLAEAEHRLLAAAEERAAGRAQEEAEDAGSAQKEAN